MTECPTTAARLNALEERLLALEDERAIRQLIAVYGPLVDSGASAAAAQLWFEDGVYDIADTAIAQGHDAIAVLFDGSFHRELIANGAAHTLGPVHIVIDGLRAAATGYWNAPPRKVRRSRRTRDQTISITAVVSEIYLSSAKIADTSTGIARGRRHIRSIVGMRRRTFNRNRAEAKHDDA
jgi:hypothetical protein